MSADYLLLVQIQNLQSQGSFQQLKVIVAISQQIKKAMVEMLIKSLDMSVIVKLVMMEQQSQNLQSLHFSYHSTTVIAMLNCSVLVGIKILLK